MKGVRVGMMATRHEDGSMHSRPMGTHHAEFDGVLWYLTELDSEKVTDTETDPDVMIAYADPDSQTYISVSGRASIVRDRAMIEELWSEPARTWFPRGKDDPNLAAIRVDVQHAEYWDAPSATMVYAYGYMKSLATGERPHDVGKTASVKF